MFYETRVLAGRDYTLKRFAEEVREILAAVVKPEKRVRVGEALASIGRKIGLTNEDLAVFEGVCDKTPAKPLGLD